MDFQIGPESEALQSLVDTILTARSSAAQLDQLDRDGTWLDVETYRHLAEAGIIGASLPERVGGGGLGFLELHHVLARVGAAAAQVPVWETVVLGALPIARHGSEALQDAILPGVVKGTTVLTAALVESGGVDARSPVVRAVPDGDGWRLSGVKTQVPLAAHADLIIVSASTSDGSVGLFLIDPSSEGTVLQDQQAVHRRPCSLLTLDGVRVEATEVMGEVGDQAVLDDVLRHAVAGLASLQAGVGAAALRMAAEYTSTREQFGRPIASFQAVGQRLADAYIDVEALALTSLQAAWRLAEGFEAENEVSIAKWWAAEGGHRVLHAAHHVHGGAGIDLDYPLHRYFRLAKYIELTLGHATHHLSRIGSQLASAPGPID